MDIGHNLFYNGCTVRSGNFLEEPKRFGKDIMRRIIRKETVGHRGTDRQGRMGIILGGVCTSVLFICIMLSGCTRREQLVLETGTDFDTVQSTSEEGSEAGTERQILQGQAEPGEREQTGFGQQEPQSQTSQGFGAEGQMLPEQSEQSEQSTIWVHVCGAVKNPDVYELPMGSRVYEAVKKAGGFAEDADESYVNQAQTLADGVKLVIPTTEQTQMMAAEDVSAHIGIVSRTGEEAGAADDGSGTGQSSTASDSGAGTTADGKININTATETQLCGIAGIGATRAAAIVAYRQEHGSFSRIEDIMNVSGIKEGTYAKIKDSITVN